MAATTMNRGSSGTLAEVVDIILDKGLVIDAYVRVSLVGIELLTIDARIVVASVDTYLHFAEAVNRLDLRAKGDENDADLQELMSGMSSGIAGSKAAGAIDDGADSLKEKAKSVVGGDDSEESDEG